MPSLRWVALLVAVSVAGCEGSDSTPPEVQPDADPQPTYDETRPDCPDPATDLPPNAWRQAAFNRTPEEQAQAWAEAIGDPIVERQRADEDPSNLHWRTERGSLSFYGQASFGTPRIIYSTDRPWPAAEPEDAIAEARRILAAFGVEGVASLNASTRPLSADTFALDVAQDGPIGQVAEMLCNVDGQGFNDEGGLRVQVGPPTPPDAGDYIQGSRAVLRPFHHVRLDGALAPMETVLANASAAREAYCQGFPNEGPPAQTDAVRPAMVGVRSGRVAYLFAFYSPTPDMESGEQWVWVDAVTGRVLDTRLNDRCD